MKCITANGMQLPHIQYTHAKICALLQSSYDALHAIVTQYSKLLPPWQRQTLKTSNSNELTEKLLEYRGKVNESDTRKGRPAQCRPLIITHR